MTNSYADLEDVSLSIPGSSELLTIAEVAQILRCSKAHVCKIINGQVVSAARLPVIELGRRRLVRRVTLLQWLSETERGATMAPSLGVDAGRRT